MTENEKLIRSGQRLKAIISHAQGRFARAIHILAREYPAGLTDEQLKKIQQEINQATIDIAVYKDLVRRCYEATGISDPDK